MVSIVGNDLSSPITKFYKEQTHSEIFFRGMEALNMGILGNLKARVTGRKHFDILLSGVKLVRDAFDLDGPVYQ